MSTDWRPLVTTIMQEVWPDLQDGVSWILAQIQVESGGDPGARSESGAVGLLQLMPETAREMGVRIGQGSDDDRTSPAINLRAGIRYLKLQYVHFSEIPMVYERLKWAFAAYNCGRGYCNRALELAKKDARMVPWSWDVTGKWYLMHRDCYVVAVVPPGTPAPPPRHPNYLQAWEYVEKIQAAKATGGRG